MVEINQPFVSFSKVICELENQALLARVGIPFCRAISSLKDVIAWIQQNKLKWADPQIDIAIRRSSQTLKSAFRNVVEIEDQDLHGPQSNVDCINEGENVRSFALHQARDQILPGRNLARENIYDNVRSEVNNHTLHGYNPT